MRSNLSWNGSVLDARFNLNVEGTYSMNLNQQRNVDSTSRPSRASFSTMGAGVREPFEHRHYHGSMPRATRVCPNRSIA